MKEGFSNRNQMGERNLPTADIFATCPTEGKVLEYYAGVFKRVYVLLHPFIKPKSIGREQFKPGSYPTRSSIVKDCAAVSWQQIAAIAGLPSIAAVDIGLRSRILGLKAHLANQEYADSISSLAKSDSILPPPEGEF
jgi:Protein of unknown function (DUF2711)